MQELLALRLRSARDVARAAHHAVLERLEEDLRAEAAQSHLGRARVRPQDGVRARVRARVKARVRVRVRGVRARLRPRATLTLSKLGSS